MDKQDLIIKVDNKITRYSVDKKVVNSGSGGAISLPKELVGKVVHIDYKINKEVKHVRDIN